MARNYGRFTTSIWRDPDFTSLTLEQQAVYFMLCTQAEVSAAGALPLTLRRWANLAIDSNVEDLEGLLEDLEEAGHVAVDRGTEELLIVKFMKWDGGWRNEKRAPVVRDAVKAIVSVHIRDIAVDEVRRFMASDALSNIARNALSDALSDGTSGSDRDVVTLGDQVPQPFTPNLEREPVDASDDPLSPFCPPHQPDGPPGACRDCGTRRVAREYRGEQAQRETAAAKLARLEAIADCRRCNENGFIEGPAHELLGVCGHSSPPSLQAVGL
jgi:hypothetical protein